MKKLFTTIGLVLLMGAGCMGSFGSDAQSEPERETWWLTFDLSSEWVIAPAYDDEQLIDVQDAIRKEVNEIYIQNTSKNIWLTEGQSPTEEEIQKLGGDEAIVYEDFTLIHIMRLDKRRVLPEEREQLQANFSRIQVCDTECTSGQGEFRYYFEGEKENYQIDVYQKGQELAVAEDIIFTASE